MSGLIPVKDFATAAECVANARAMHRLFRGKAKNLSRKEIEVLAVERDKAKRRAEMGAQFLKMVQLIDMHVAKAAMIEPPAFAPHYRYPIGPLAPGALRTSLPPDSIAYCARLFRVTKDDILSRRREARQAMARQSAMWLTKHTTKLSLPEIGRRFEGRDHTTVIHACRRVDKLISKLEVKGGCPHESIYLLAMAHHENA
jgi:Bacterial dnaA protein helix-turn-helix